VTTSILNLAATYGTAVAFRNNVLAVSARGRELLKHYYVFLPEIYAVASRDLGLAHEAALTWLEIYPFVLAVVRTAEGEDAPTSSGAAAFGERPLARFLALVDRFRESTHHAAFSCFLGELREEIAGYAGVSPSDALERILSTTAE
jgi:hypothetical protein